MSAILFWVGPVMTANIAGIRWRSPVTTVTHPCGGAAGGSTHCYADGARLAAGGRSPLEALASEAGVKIPPGTRIALASFSAGYGLVDHLLRSPADRARVALVALFDSYYSAPGTVAAKPGIGAYALEALRGLDSRLILTSSGVLRGDPRQNTASAWLPVADALSLGPPEVRPDWGHPAEWQRRSGGVRWIHYGASRSHGEHATRIAPAALEAQQDWLEAPPPRELDSASAAGKFAAIAAALALIGDDA